MEKYIMAIDQGTTSSRAILFNHDSEPIAMAQREFTQHFPQPGWVEHDANEIWMSVLSVMASCLQQAGIQPQQVAGIGITNQRETTVVWNRTTGLPIANAIVWQSRQTAEICDQLIRDGYDDLVRSRTGLRIDPYFSATKVRWILDHTPNGQKMAEDGELLAGTIDSWLIWCLSGNQVHVTDYSNASRTMLYNIYEKKWDPDLCAMLNIPMKMLPEVKDSSGIFAYTAPYHFFGQQVPISGVAGDQQAALFGQNCRKSGGIKATYGTGSSVMMNIGEKPVLSESGLVTSIAWGIGGKVSYVLEGNLNYTGAVITWLKDEMHLISSAGETEELAENANPKDRSYFIPAFTGLGAPYWDSEATGLFTGITRTTGRNEMVRACLDSIAYQITDLVKSMRKESGQAVRRLHVDGGPTANRYLMQFQASMAETDVIVPDLQELSGMGAAYLAGISCGLYDSERIFEHVRHSVYRPDMDGETRELLYGGWKKAVAQALTH